MEVNPYLFYLLQQMLFYETSYFFEKVSETTVCQYVSIIETGERNPEKVRALANANFLIIDVPDDIGGFARQIFDKRKNFKVPLSQLNRLAESITFLDSYRHWNDVESSYMRRKRAYWDGPYLFEKYKSSDYKTLSDSGIIAKIKEGVFAEVGRIVDRKRLEGVFEGKKFSYLVTDVVEHIAIRFAEYYDFDEIQSLRQQFDLSSEQLDREFLNGNTTVFVITNYIPKVVGIFSLFPITESLFGDLLSGKTKFHTPLTKSLFKGKIPSCFLLTDLLCMHDDFIRSFSMHIPNLLNSLFGYQGRNTKSFKAPAKTMFYKGKFDKTHEYPIEIIANTKDNLCLLNFGFRPVKDIKGIGIYTYNLQGMNHTYKSKDELQN